MATFVINGTTVNLNSDNMEINVESDGKVYITEGGFWPKPINVGDPIVRDVVLQKPAGQSMREFVQSCFPKKGTVKLVRSLSDKSIRGGFYALGRSASVKQVEKNVFEVKRVS
jgi:hypothetical protein